MTNIVSNILSGIEITKIYDVNHNGIKNISLRIHSI